MSKKSKNLIITGIALVAIVLILIFSPILKSEPIAIEPEFTYLDAITSKDAPDSDDKDYRRHNYSLTVAVNTTYTFAASSLSDDEILVFEYEDGNKTQILAIDPMGSGTTDYHFTSAGLKIIYVEAPADDLPADYSLRVTLIEGEST